MRWCGTITSSRTSNLKSNSSTTLRNLLRIEDEQLEQFKYFVDKACNGYLRWRGTIKYSEEALHGVDDEQPSKNVAITCGGAAPSRTLTKPSKPVHDASSGYLRWCGTLKHTDKALANNAPSNK